MLRLADLEQSKNAVGSVKDIQAHLRRSKADTTANEYIQELPESVGWMVESIYEESRVNLRRLPICYRMLLTRKGALPLSE
jgi:hypothetical protein